MDALALGLLIFSRKILILPFPTDHQLKDRQLKEFIIQMNKLGDQCSGTTIVAKRIFVQFFHDTIDKAFNRHIVKYTQSCDLNAL